MFIQLYLFLLTANSNCKSCAYILVNVTKNCFQNEIRQLQVKTGVNWLEPVNPAGNVGSNRWLRRKFRLLQVCLFSEKPTVYWFYSELSIGSVPYFILRFYFNVYQFYSYSSRFFQCVSYFIRFFVFRSGYDCSRTSQMCSGVKLRLLCVFLSDNASPKMYDALRNNIIYEQKT